MIDLELKRKLMKKLGFEGKYTDEELKRFETTTASDGKEYFWYIYVKSINSVENYTVEGAIDENGNIITDEKKLDELFV